MITMRMNEYQKEIIFRQLRDLKDRSPFYSKKY